MLMAVRAKQSASIQPWRPWRGVCREVEAGARSRWRESAGMRLYRLRRAFTSLTMPEK